MGSEAELDLLAAREPEGLAGVGGRDWSRAADSDGESEDRGQHALGPSLQACFQFLQRLLIVP